MLKLVEFINNHEDWRDLIAQKPYCITVKEDGNYMIFNYNQIESDFHNPIVKECRGIILHKDSYRPVCVPFFKFGNYGESYVDTIDWNTAIVEEKVDGSLIKMWYDDGQWHISTNGTINAYNAMLSNNIKYNNFGELVDAAMQISWNTFDIVASKDFTYMFELVSPYNRVVVPYTETRLYFIGCRNNETLCEINPADSDVANYFDMPKTYNLFSLESCIETARVLPFDKEGYVVVDSAWHRNKIKSPAWVAVHHMIDNGNINKKRIVELVMTGEDGEFLNYYPEYSDSFKHISNLINEWLFNTTQTWMSIQIKLGMCKTRKEIANVIMSTDINSAVCFNLIDKKVASINEWLHKQSAEKILNIIGEE